MILISMLAPSAVFSSLSLRYKTAPFIDQQSELSAWRQAEASPAFITQASVQPQALWQISELGMFPNSHRRNAGKVNSDTSHLRSK